MHVIVMFLDWLKNKQKLLIVSIAYRVVKRLETEQGRLGLKCKQTTGLITVGVGKACGILPV